MGSKKAFAVITIGPFLSMLDVTIVNTAFSDIKETFSDSSITSLAWVLSSYNLTLAALMIPLGRIADLIGRKKMYLIGLSAFLLGSILCATSPSLPFLITARVIQSAGAAALVPSSVSLLLAEFSPDQRTKVINAWGAAAALATAIGPALGGFLIHYLNWRFVFLINIPFLLLTIWIGAKSLNESRDRLAKRADTTSTVLLTTALLLLTLLIINGEDWGWTSSKALLSLTGALTLGTSFIRRNSRVANPVFEHALLAERTTAVGNAGSMFFAMGFYGFLLCNVIFLTHQWHYSILKTGLALTPAPLLGGISALIGGRIAQRFGYVWAIVPGVLLFAAGMLGMVSISDTTTPNFLTEWLPTSLIAGSGAGLAFPTLGSAAVHSLKSKFFATGSAILSTSRQIGGVIGVSVIIAVIAQATPLTAGTWLGRGWLFCIGTALLSGAISLGLGRVHELPSETEIV